MKKSVKLICLIMAAMLVCAACGGKNGNKEFIWQGLADAVIVSGDAFNPFDGVTVKYGDADISGKVRILNDDNDEDYAILEAEGLIDDFDNFDHNSPGVYLVFYRVEHDGKSDLQARKVTVQQKHNLSNGDFGNANNTAFNSWRLDTPGGVATVAKYNDGGKTVPKLTISESGNNWYALQYMNTTPNIVQGEIYRITVRAKSSTGKSVAFGFEDANSNYAMLKHLTIHKLTGEYQVYESYFEPESNINGVKAVLYFGRMLPTDRGNHEIVLDYINIEKIEKCSEVNFTGISPLGFTTTPDSYGTITAFKDDPLSGVSITKDGDPVNNQYVTVIGELPEYVTENAIHDLVYKVSVPNAPVAFAIRKVNVNVGTSNPANVMNGSFMQDYDYWTKDLNAGSGSRANYEIISVGEGASARKEAQITILDPATADWHVQLNQMVAQLEASTTYTITVVAKAKNAFTASFEMRAATKFPLAFDGGNDYQTFTFEYLSTSKGNAKAAFLLGGGGSAGNADNVYTIRSVNITKGTELTGEPYEMFNSSFQNGLQAWTSEVNFGAAAFSGITDEDQTKCATVTLNSASYGNNWNVQLRQDGKSFQSGKTYKVTIVAKSDTENRAMKLEIVKLGDTNSTLWDKAITLTSSAETYELTFTATSNLSDIRVGLLLGQNGMQGSVVTIYEFSIELVG